MLKTLLELIKPKITVAVMLTTITGYVLAAGRFQWHMAITVAGLFLLAAGSAALNQFQEHRNDAIMQRTARRPIPSGRISPAGALLFVLTLSVTGALMIYINSGTVAALLGLAALVWYNAVYTPLKKMTPYAVIPGSVIGALPPLVGWVAGGGQLSDPRAAIMAFFFFIWQVPHFWLLMIKYGSQYEEAGYPSLQKFYSEVHIRRITFLWIFSTGITALMLPVFGVVESPVTALGIMGLSSWLILTFVKLLKLNIKEFRPMRYFMKINIYVLLIIIILTADRFF